MTYLSLLIIFVVHTLLLNTLVMIYFISVIFFTWILINYFYGTVSNITTNDHRYILFLVITIRTFPHSWHINRYVTRLTRLVATSGTGTDYLSRVPEFTHKWSSCCSTFSFLCSILKIIVRSFVFRHCIVYPSSIYILWLPIWYLQTFYAFHYTNVFSFNKHSISKRFFSNDKLCWHHINVYQMTKWDWVLWLCTNLSKKQYANNIKFN